MSKQDLDNAIHRMQPRERRVGVKAGPPQFVSEDLPEDQRGAVVCFDIKGQPTEDERHCAAKIVALDSGRTLFFVKFCVDGPDKGHFLNPYSIYYREGDDHLVASRRGQHRYEFRRVTEPIFDSYRSFLRTRTFAYCQAAEREYLNA